MYICQIVKLFHLPTYDQLTEPYMALRNKFPRLAASIASILFMVRVGGTDRWCFVRQIWAAPFCNRLCRWVFYLNIFVLWFFYSFLAPKWFLFVHSLSTASYFPLTTTVFLSAALVSWIFLFFCWKIFTFLLKAQRNWLMSSYDNISLFTVKNWHISASKIWPECP